MRLSWHETVTVVADHPDRVNLDHWGNPVDLDDDHLVPLRRRPGNRGTA